MGAHPALLPWQYNLDAAARRMLEAEDWTSPRPTALPTGAELVENYLTPLADTPELRGHIRWGTRITAIARTAAAEGAGAFLLSGDQHGAPTQAQARAVIDASGTWDRPNTLGAPDAPVPGEDDPSVQRHLLGALPDVLGRDRSRCAGRRALVVGSGHSAVNSLLSLAALKREEPRTQILWAIRGHDPERTYGGGEADQLPERGALGQRLRRLVESEKVELLTAAGLDRLHSDAGSLTVTFTDGRTASVDSLISATGFGPDLGPLSSLELDLDSQLLAPRSLAPLIDPAIHSCGTVPAHGADVLSHPEEGFFIAGMKSYGRAPTFLMATGYEQVRSIAAELAARTLPLAT
ncbi:NAD(P)-binding domain-containing protein [Nesterenkonia pannonica]|uniref:NAD(P)-binding domain-containing protein n=1 Tax=Nesterenkonia pannonica TaxID=1548602 RepID=UPI002164CB4B|nr:NAD(P)-binding domain-containing protein [Nesterenkonia pannonica]